MKNKILTTIILTFLLLCSLTACKKEDDSKQICSGCEEEKECQTYTVDGVDYLVCDDCYEEFAIGMGLIEDPAKQICSGCEEEKECKTYTVDGVEYFVCDDCYEEFATGMGLLEDEEIDAQLICSLCEKEKDCKTYTIDNIKYVICDDCFDEFAYAFGLDGAPEDVPLTAANSIDVCSLCEMEKDCDTYTVDGQEYIVCPDCYNEFAHAFGLIDDGETASAPAAQEETSFFHVCGGCEEEKQCRSYDIDGTEYIVCDDCYEEFATGMGINE